ncbi:MAG TPA: hypothetical protein DC057_01370 [Spirochaetia bacterium]|nr:hypothetical protein [Spirochaetia bacterium]
MSLIVISENNKKSYQALSSDIVGGKIDNASWIGADVYIVDTQQWYRVGEDLILYPLTSVSESVLRNEVVITMDSGSGISGSATISSTDLAALITPSDWTTNNVSFRVSHGDGIFTSLKGYDTGTEYYITSASAGGWYPLTLQNFYGVTDLQVISGLSASPIAQSGSRIITLVTRSL